MYSNMIAALRLISNTHNKEDDIKWAEDNNHIERLEKTA